MTGIVAADRVVHRDELGAVGEGGLHLDDIDQLGDTLHDIGLGEDAGARGHEVGDGAAVTRSLQQLGGDVGHGLGMVELDAALEATASDVSCHEDQQLLLFSRCDPHCSSLDYWSLVVLPKGRDGWIPSRPFVLTGWLWGRTRP